MTDGPERTKHWDLVYETRGPSEVSWYQGVPRMSMELVRQLGVTVDAPVIDVGGGESTLVDHLLAAGFDDITVLDVSGIALADGPRRLGLAPVHRVKADVLDWLPDRRYGLWHDRAVFHFLVDPVDRAAYGNALRAATGAGGAFIVGTFAPEGPPSCSGLPVARYSADALAAELGEGLEIVTSREEEHVTPGGSVQRFTWVAGRSAEPASHGPG